MLLWPPWRNNAVITSYQCFESIVNINRGRNPDYLYSDLHTITMSCSNSEGIAHCRLSLFPVLLVPCITLCFLTIPVLSYPCLRLCPLLLSIDIVIVRMYYHCCERMTSNNAIHHLWFHFCFTRLLYFCSSVAVFPALPLPPARPQLRWIQQTQQR